MTASPFRGLSRATQRPVVGVVAAAAFVLALAPAASASATPAHFLVEHLDFTSYQCRANTQPVVCDVTITGPVRSNLSTTPGIADYTVVLTWEPFEGSPCNTVDERTRFSFASGTLTVHSVHRDCPATIRPGPRIQSDFRVVGGTGAFARASGGGYEVASVPSEAPVVYNGFVAF